MSTRSAHGGGQGRATADVQTLPNELLLAIWEELPPLERVCLSQVCRRLRSMALSTPSIWTSVALVVTGSSASNGVHTVYHPRSHSDNLSLLKTLIARSHSLPLDLLVDMVEVEALPRALRSLLKTNRLRLARLHFTNGPPDVFNSILKYCTPFPALRMLTGGFDDGHVVSSDRLSLLPGPPSPALPVLSQIHLGVEASTFINWEQVSLPSIRELTVTPRWQEDLVAALTACANVVRLTVILSLYRLRPMPWTHRPPQKPYVDALARIPRLCLSDMPVEPARERFILALVDDQRFRDLRLEYTTIRDAPVPRSETFPCLCGALEDPLRLSVRLRAGAHEVAVVDRAGRRREIIVHHTPPSLWSFFLRHRAVSAAEVDARAWAYFAADAPTIPVADLTLVVAQDAAELDGVSLEAVPALSALRVATLRPRIHFDRAVLERLVGSRPATRTHPVLPVLALAPSASVEDENALAAFAVALER